MKCLMSILAAATMAFAASAPVIQGMTSKQIAFRYSRPDAAPCTWAVSVNADYSNPVADSGQDSAAEGIRWFVAGAGGALSPATVHYWQQTCGSEVYAGSFTTLAAGLTGTTDVYVSLGGAEKANGATFLWGPTPALGNQATAVCKPRCSAVFTVDHDSLMFYNHWFKNGEDAITAPGVVRVMAIK